MDDWQAIYDWACQQPEEAALDGEWWWSACLANVLAKAMKGTSGIVSASELKAPQPEDQWKSDMLTELYSVLFPEQKLTVGQFKTVLEKVKPPLEKL